MRIALVTSSFLPHIGGAEFVIQHLAQEWSKQGHQVVVANAVSNRPVDGDQYEVRRFRVLRGSFRLGFHHFPFLGYACRGISRILSEFNPDFISAHFAYPTAYWLVKLKWPFVVTCHGGDIWPTAWGYRKVYNLDTTIADVLNRATKVIAISTFASSLLGELGVNPDHIVHIPNGVEIERFRKDVSFNLRDRFNLPSNAKVILTVGRNHPAKDYGTGIRAFSQVATVVPDVYYLLLGREVQQWQRLVDELGLGSRVILSSGLYGDELVGAYRQAEVFFSCSVQEMFPLVVAEAMAAGLPAVVTNVSGSQDMIQSGVNGLVVNPGQVNEMAEALLTLLRDECMRKKMGQASGERSADYSWDLVSRKYLETFSS